MTNLEYNIAPPWKENTSYDVGKCLIYNGQVYQCKTAHTSGNSFEPENFIERNLSDMMNCLSSNLGKLTFSNFVEGTSFDVIVGEYYVVTTQGTFSPSYFTGGTVVTQHVANVNENYISTGIIKATSNKITVKNMFKGGSISHISISK